MQCLQTFLLFPSYPSVCLCLSTYTHFPICFCELTVTESWTGLVCTEFQHVEDKGSRAQGSHQFRKHNTVRAGRPTAQYFPWDTKQTVVLYSQTPPRYLFVPVSHRYSERKQLFSILFYVFLWCPVLYCGQSFTHQTLSLSHSPAAPIHSATLMSLQTISLTITLKELELTLFFLLCSPLFLLPCPQLAFLSLLLHFTPYLPFPLSISLAQSQSPLPWRASRQLKAMHHSHNTLHRSKRPRNTLHGQDRSQAPSCTRICSFSTISFFFSCSDAKNMWWAEIWRQKQAECGRRRQRNRIKRR